MTATATPPSTNGYSADNFPRDRLTAAGVYYGYRILPIPVPHRSKDPGFSGWQNLRPTLDDLPRLFPDGPGNTGLLLGEPSDNLIDVDIDSKEAAFAADVFLPPTTWVSGRHG